LRFDILLDSSRLPPEGKTSKALSGAAQRQLLGPGFIALSFSCTISACILLYLLLKAITNDVYPVLRD
jgi:hypothetical protein